ncbi:helix-turn-helix domain-containing protein [Chitinophaga silvisoli]|uniref:AraC family transcriptional regulator n=1 Tax=Chitinophaga silvisoli TaxID=2291814 RepID=A0A3E1P1K5_9BACT|nr:helix-turn-helix transcriptional regulator [Chitinophaga silvisoli]RFM34061.1 AraC family transcriptional regulator [Chitinophaga silvisoli]
MGKSNQPAKINSIADVHRLFSLPNPQHPLISLINNVEGQLNLHQLPDPHVLHFYKISYKSKLSGKMGYGQGYYDFDEGGLMFAAPNQVLSMPEDPQDHAGYTLLIHPDFLLGFPLSRKIKQYGFFSYQVAEALFLSDKEREVILSLFKIMEEELTSRIDDFSQTVVIAQIELLLSYAERFYKRQFITRKAVNSELLARLEQMMDEYFNSGTSMENGIPSVQYFADRLNLSASYLSDMLRSLTGQNAQQLIHHKLIEKAKEMLSTSELSVAEVAFQLGFEYPQSFSRLFKTKTDFSPLAFRRKFN